MSDTPNKTNHQTSSVSQQPATNKQEEGGLLAKFIARILPKRKKKENAKPSDDIYPLF